MQQFTASMYLSLTLHHCPIARYLFIQLSELGHSGENKNAQASKQHQRGFEPRLPRLSVCHSTAELQRSDKKTLCTSLLKSHAPLQIPTQFYCFVSLLHDAVLLGRLQHRTRGLYKTFTFVKKKFTFPSYLKNCFFNMLDYNTNVTTLSLNTKM